MSNIDTIKVPNIIDFSLTVSDLETAQIMIDMSHGFLSLAHARLIRIYIPSINQYYQLNWELDDRHTISG